MRGKVCNSLHPRKTRHCRRLRESARVTRRSRRSTLPGSRSTTFEIGHTWDGAPIADAPHAAITFTLGESSFALEVDSHYYADPPPAAPPGSLDGLWEFEVVELFLLGDDERYLELELSPHGHYLALQLHHPRMLVAKGFPLDYRCRHEGERWWGHAEGDAALLPPGLHSANAYAIHGLGAHRRYLAAHPVASHQRVKSHQRVESHQPDFHRLETFEPLQWQSR